MEKYKEFKKEYYFEDFDIEAVNAGVLVNKLLQFANGSIFNSERDVKYIHDKKLQALDTLVQESMGEPLLVFYSYTFDRDAIKKKYPYAVEINEVDDLEAKWNNNEIPMLLAHPASAAHGLNLQKGDGHVCIWYGLSWSLELFQQALKRLARSGQKNKVINHYILARDTADEVVLKTLLSKGAKQDDVINAVKMQFKNKEWVDV